MADPIVCPDWLTEGAKVATITRRHGGIPSVALVTVERITRTQVKVRNENDGITVFKAGSYDPNEIVHDVGGTWGTRYALRPLNDPEVADARRRSRLMRAAAQIEDLALKWRRDENLDAAGAIADELVEAGVIASYEPAKADS